MNAPQETKQPRLSKDAPRMLWHVLFDARVLVTCLCVSAGFVGLVIWQMDGRLHHLRQNLSKESESFGKLEPLITQKGGDVRKAMLALASKIEQTDDGKIVELSLEYTGILDDELAHLREFPDLRTLSLAGTKVTDNGLQHLAQLKNLQSLSLYYTGIADNGIRHLRDCRHLQFINLVATGTTAKGLSDLADLPELETLILELAPLSDADLETFQHFPKLTALDLINTKITEEGIEKLRTALPNCVVYGP